MNEIRHTIVDSPIGPLTVVADDDTIVEVRFANNQLAAGEGGERNDEDPLLASARTQLNEYFSGGRRVFDLPLAPRGTEFQVAAWAALRTIPYGETVSYGEQARRLGHINKSRAVGAANGKNPLPIVVPCHRVVGTNGTLTGFGGGLEAKSWLLDHELQHR